jgi:hypothetical protein
MAVMELVKPQVFIKEDKAVNFLPIVVAGGLGDLIIALPLIESIKARVGAVQVYSNYPGVHRLMGNPADVAPEQFTGYDLYLLLQSAPRFMYGNTFMGFHAQSIEDLALDWHRISGDFPEISRFSHYQPYFDQELSIEAMKAGFTRMTLGHHMLGFKAPTLFGWSKLQHDPMIDFGQFITVNDAVDQTQTQIPYRSTKSWNFGHISEFVRLFKDNYPDILVVQIGAQNSRPIPGTDINLAGRMTVEGTIRLLKSSLLHVDVEGGLVHAAHALGIRSVVGIGPTPAKFFSYAENFNVMAEGCSGCYWTTPSWMSKCPAYEKPTCMDSITGDRLFGAADILMGYTVAIKARGIEL